MSGFKLNSESQFDILHAIFYFNFSLYWGCSWHKKKKKGCWLVGCFGLNGPLRQYFSLYRAVSQREGERKEK